MIVSMVTVSLVTSPGYKMPQYTDSCHGNGTLNGSCLNLISFQLFSGRDRFLWAKPYKLRMGQMECTAGRPGWGTDLCRQVVL